MDSVDVYPRRRAFEVPDAGVSVHQARCLFFHAVHRVNPRVIDELMGEPLELSRSLVPLLEQTLRAVPPPREVEGRYLSLARDGLMPYWEVIKSSEFVTAQEPEEFRLLRDVLRHWADRSRLWPADSDDDWCLAIAADALAQAIFYNMDKTDPFGFINLLVPHAFSGAEVYFSLEVEQGWQPTVEEWADADRRFDDAYRRAKQDYKARLERACRETGLQPVPNHRRRKGNHYEWLALYQTRKWPWTRIAEFETRGLAKQGDRDGVSQTAIARAAKEKAQFIGLKVAESKPGRPIVPTRAAKTGT